MCNHISTVLTEEGYECLDCGRVLGHSWKRRQPSPEPTEGTYEDWLRYHGIEVPSWDVYQPVV
jgi:hypothetical protein